MKKNKKGMYLGIDPGTTHFGIAVIHTCDGDLGAELYQVEMERHNDPILRVQGLYYLLGQCVNWSCYPMYACIEGASYGDQYRQVELAEARTVAMMWCRIKNFNTSVKPPLAVRRYVFGNGKIKGRDIWKNIPPDCADALACAYWSLFMAGE